jgi:hypothetical protein
MDFETDTYKIYWNDLKKAEQEEIENIELIKEILDIEKLEKDKDRFSVYDFKTDDSFIEFRRRYCNLKKYKTTMIPRSKINFSNKTKKPCWIFIKFNDCITLWKVPKNLHPQYLKGGRCDRGENEYKYNKQYYYLDIDELDVFEIIEEE